MSDRAPFCDKALIAKALELFAVLHDEVDAQVVIRTANCDPPREVACIIDGEDLYWDAEGDSDETRLRDLIARLRRKVEAEQRQTLKSAEYFRDGIVKARAGLEWAEQCAAAMAKALEE